MKIKKIPYLCWDLNPQPLDHESRAIPQDHLGRWIWRVLSLWLTKHVQSLTRWQFVLNFVNLEKRLLAGQRDPILSFVHSFAPKSACFGGCQKWTSFTLKRLLKFTVSVQRNAVLFHDWVWLSLIEFEVTKKWNECHCHECYFTWNYE